MVRDRMHAVEQAIGTLLQDAYRIEAALAPLPGEHDLNLRLRATNGNDYLLKLHAPGDDAELEMQMAVLDYLETNAPELALSRAIRTRQGAVSIPADIDGPRTARLLTWLPGTIWAKSTVRGRHSAEALGRLLGR